MLGAAIHGLTAAHIGSELAAGVSGTDPLASLLAGSPTLLVLWGLSALLVAVASALFLWFVARGTTSAPPVSALAKPALVTVTLALLGLSSVALRSFLTSTAPNLSHIIFFLVCARLSGESESQVAERAVQIDEGGR